MTDIRTFFNTHKPKSTPGVHDLALASAGSPSASGSIALDVCCGSGKLTGQLADQGFRVVGIDISTRYIGQSGDAAHRYVVANTSLTLPFRDGCAALVCCIDSLQYFANPEQVLHELARVLEPGGILILSTQNNYNPTGLKRVILEKITGRTWSPWLTHPVENHITAPWLISALNRAGFQMDQARGLQFMTAWVGLLPAAIRNYAPWPQKPWRSLSGLAQRVRLPTVVEKSTLWRFAMIIFIRARKR